MWVEELRGYEKAIKITITKQDDKNEIIFQTFIFELKMYFFYFMDFIYRFSSFIDNYI